MLARTHDTDSFWQGLNRCAGLDRETSKHSQFAISPPGLWVTESLATRRVNTSSAFEQPKARTRPMVGESEPPCRRIVQLTLIGRLIDGESLTLLAGWSDATVRLTQGLAREGDLLNGQRLHEQPYQAHTGTGGLPVGAAWSLTLLLSLGLWAAIWLAVSSLLLL